MSTRPSFKDMVAANRPAGPMAAPRKIRRTAGRTTVQSGMQLSPADLAQAQELAGKEERSVSSFMRRMYQRGLASYLAETSGSTAAQS